MFLQAAMTAAHRCAYTFSSMENVETFRHTGWFRAVLDSLQGLFLKLSSSFQTTNSITCASKRFEMSFDVLKKAEIMHRDFADLPSRAEVFAFQRRSSRDLRLYLLPLWRVFQSRLASVNGPFQVKRYSVWKRDGFLETLLSMSVLQ